MVNGRYVSIDVLKAIAALLIINSHLELIYPSPWMAADGMLGNTLFFFTTGFTLAGSLQRHPAQTLAKFLWLRISRLYPALWITMVLLPPQAVVWNDPRNWIGIMVYPTCFSFVLTIVPLYPFFFLFMRSNLKETEMKIFAIFLIALGCFTAWWRTAAIGDGGLPWSELGHMAWVLHFGGSMLLGGCMALRNGGRAVCKSTSLIVGACVALFCVYLALRVMALSVTSATLGIGVRRLAVISMPMALILILSMKALLETPAIEKFASRGGAFVIISFLAAHSWETYLLHLGVSKWSFVSAQPFPVSLLLVFILTFLLAPLLRWGADRMLLRGRS